MSDHPTREDAEEAHGEVGFLLPPEDVTRLADRLEAIHGDDLEGMLAEAWRMGADVACNGLAERRTCRICGCWDQEACEGGCWRVEDDLCSSCQTVAGPANDAADAELEPEARSAVSVSVSRCVHGTVHLNLHGPRDEVFAQASMPPATAAAIAANLIAEAQVAPGSGGRPSTETQH